MKEVNLVEILKDVPKGTKLWSNVCGEITLEGITRSNLHPIDTRTNAGIKVSFDIYGKLYEEMPNAECVLWPSKEIRDWSRWEEELKWREIEQWITDGVCEFKIDQANNKWKKFTDGQLRNGTIPEEWFRKADSYQYLRNAIKEGKQIEFNSAISTAEPTWKIECKPTFIYPPERYRIYDPYRELKEAYERGEVIQVLQFSDKGQKVWNDAEKYHCDEGDLTWRFPVEHYRIKPKEPVYVPFTFEDYQLFAGALCRIKETTCCFYVWSWDLENMYHPLIGLISYSEAFKTLEIISKPNERECHYKDPLIFGKLQQ